MKLKTTIPVTWFQTRKYYRMSRNMSEENKQETPPKEKPPFSVPQIKHILNKYKQKIHDIFRLIISFNCVKNKTLDNPLIVKLLC